MPATYLNRIPKKLTKTITFDGTSGNGATGTVTIATISQSNGVNDSVLILHLGVRCTTDLTSSGGTIELGVASNTASLIAQTTATAIDSGEFWQDATPELGVSPAIVNQLVAKDIIATIGSAGITAGVLEFNFYYLPLNGTGDLS